MRLNFTVWILCVLVSFYVQNAVSRAQDCTDKQYSRGNRCCKKCGPGFRVFSYCTDTEDTKCIKCLRDEYQSGWTEEKRCRQQKFCDEGKGFMERPENLEAEEPCRCRPGLQCCAINCEYCEAIPTCSAGHGLEVLPDSANGRKVCVPCKKGFFSSENGAEQCKQWTDCKAEGRSETKPGSTKADAVCGIPVPGATPSWVIVSVLSVITVLCLLILLLFCYKDKLKLLSVNLRSCVQNLKRTRIQQETLAPLYHSGPGGGPGGPRCTPCETTKLVCQAPHSPTDETPCTLPDISSPDVRVSLPLTGETDGAGTKVEDQSEGSGEPEEVSEDEELVSTSPLLAGSCVCVIPIREPLEVGENEDCSQAVSPGTLGTCSCRGLDTDESGKAERSDGGGALKREKMLLSKSDTGVASLISMSPPLLHTSSVIPPSGPLPECRAHLADRPMVKQEDFYRLGSTDSTSTESSSTSSMTLVSPLVTSSSVGDLYLDKPAEQSQGLSWGESKGNKLCSVVSDLECAPESLHSQLAEPTPTSGQVSGSHNTTFISSGQVMNFSGDVIVVYVSQTSQSSDGAGQDDASPTPAQKETNETAQFFPSCRTSQDETLPVQEVMDERLLGK